MTSNGRLTKWIKAYFHWLEQQVRDEGRPTHTYSEVMEMMFSKEFVWTVPNDDNRVQDGLDLRLDFLDESEAPDSLRPEHLGPCSVLEVLIGLSRRLAFMAGGNPEGWAWQLVVNLELHRMADPLSRTKQHQVNEKLDAVIWRTYRPDGTGGFFPLAWPDDDQTQIELWYQMNAYVMEINP
jgi:hypothetical protein